MYVAGGATSATGAVDGGPLTATRVMTSCSTVLQAVTGVQTVRALEACGLLAAEGVSAHLVHIHTLKPIDVQGVAAAAKKTGRALTTEEHNIFGGLGGAVAEVLGQHAPVPMRIHGLQDCFLAREALWPMRRQGWAGLVLAAGCAGAALMAR